MKKGEAKPKDVDAYVAGAAEAARPILEELRRIVTSIVPDAEERIAWGVPFYRHHGALAGFAVYTAHVSFGSGGADLSAGDREALEAMGYATGKKTVQIRFGQDVPAEAIARIVTAQAAANEAAEGA
jgi:uncharacterized protein